MTSFSSSTARGPVVVYDFCLRARPGDLIDHQYSPRRGFADYFLPMRWPEEPEIDLKECEGGPAKVWAAPPKTAANHLYPFAAALVLLVSVLLQLCPRRLAFISHATNAIDSSMCGHT